MSYDAGYEILFLYLLICHLVAIFNPIFGTYVNKIMTNLDCTYIFLIAHLFALHNVYLAF